MCHLQALWSWTLNYLILRHMFWSKYRYIHEDDVFKFRNKYNLKNYLLSYTPQYRKVIHSMTKLSKSILEYQSNDYKIIKDHQIHKYARPFLQERIACMYLCPAKTDMCSVNVWWWLKEKQTSVSHLQLVCCKYVLKIKRKLVRTV